jgi:hypothetical protein
MSNTIEKVKRLEEYLSLSPAAADPVLDATLDKLLSRERARLQAVKDRLTAQISDFETRYALPSDVFYSRYNWGELGDTMDFIEWAATLEMLGGVEKSLSLLDIV